MAHPRTRSRVQALLIALGAIVFFAPSITTNLFGDGLANWAPSSEPPRFALEDWLSGDFQDAADIWFRDRFGLRSVFVRLDNQVKWSLFSKMEGDGLQKLVFGRDDHLIQWAFVEYYCGISEPPAVDRLQDLAGKLRRVQDGLEARGVAFMLVISPNKVSVHPEYMPEQGCPPRDDHGPAYARALPLLEEAGVHVVDNFQAARRGIRRHPDVVLFPRGASHWNRLGAFYGAEAILLEVDALVPQDVPPIVLEGYREHREPEGDDADLTRMMNLLWTANDYPTAEPEVSTKGEIDRPLRAIVVGGSYMMLPLELLGATTIFEQLDYYFYLDSALVDYTKGNYHTAATAPVDVDAIDWAGDILQADVIILEVNMADFFSMHVEPFTTALLEQLEKEEG
jgi:hypothetical protein